MKKIGVLGFIICFLIGTFSFMTYQQTLAETADTGEFLAKAFAASNAQVEGYSIRNWSVIDEEARSVEELTALGRGLNKTFGILNAKESAGAEGDTNSYTLRGTWKDGSETQLVIKSMKFQGRAPQTVLVLRVDRETQDLNEYSQAIQQVRETARQANTIPQISTCIKGFLADKMKNGDSNVLVESVFSAVNAKEIEGVRSDLVTSVSGYSPLAKDYIVTGGDKMNLQVAVHYDAYQGKTRLVVGSPIVTIEY